MVGYIGIRNGADASQASVNYAATSHTRLSSSGATLNEFMRPNSKEAHSLFAAWQGLEEGMGHVGDLVNVIKDHVTSFSPHGFGMV